MFSSSLLFALLCRRKNTYVSAVANLSFAYPPSFEGDTSCDTEFSINNDEVEIHLECTYLVRRVSSLYDRCLNRYFDNGRSFNHRHTDHIILNLTSGPTECVREIFQTDGTFPHHHVIYYILHQREIISVTFNPLASGPFTAEHVREYEALLAGLRLYSHSPLYIAEAFDMYDKGTYFINSLHPTMRDTLKWTTLYLFTMFVEMCFMFGFTLNLCPQILSPSCPVHLMVVYGIFYLFSCLLSCHIVYKLAPWYTHHRIGGIGGYLALSVLLHSLLRPGFLLLLLFHGLIAAFSFLMVRIYIFRHAHMETGFAYDYHDFTTWRV